MFSQMRFATPNQESDSGYRARVPREEDRKSIGNSMGKSIAERVAILLDSSPQEMGVQRWEDETTTPIVSPELPLQKHLAEIQPAFSGFLQITRLHDN